MAKIKPAPKTPARPEVIKAKTRTAQDMLGKQGYKWWLARSKKEMAEQVISTAMYLREKNQWRYRQAAIYGRLYSNKSLFNFVGTNMSRQTIGASLPADRPTMNVVQSCIDTLVSRITQSRPRPVFLTDNGDYRQRRMAQQMNSFINGELYQVGAHDQAKLLLRNACILGTSAFKVFEDANRRVALDHVLSPELLVDDNDAYYGKPTQLFQIKLVDKSVFKEMYPDSKPEIQNAQQGFPDNSADAQKTISDQIIVVEAWHLPSSKDAADGRHVIASTAGLITDTEWTKERFPFVFFNFSDPVVGFWGQGLCEQLMGTQFEINQMLITASRSINLMGVPRIFIEKGSKLPKAHFTNNVGMIGEFSGTPPIIVPGNTGLTPDFYAHLERLIQFAYQQSGISALAATSQKPAGLNSGEAIRNYDDLQSDRFAALSRAYDLVFIKLAYQIIELAKEIADRDGKYQTVYPNKNGTKEITLPDVEHLEDPFAIECFDASSLPRDPAGRLQKITEMMQAGLLSLDEGRRLLDYPDIEQVDKLQNASEERILQILDEIVEEGKYTPPDPFMNLSLATQLCSQYYNLYVPAKLEESKAQMLRDFFTQLQAIAQAAQPPPQPQMPQGQPQAVPAERPVSQMLPQIPQG